MKPKKIGTFNYNDETLKVIQSVFEDNNATAIFIQDENGQPFAKLSVNVEGITENLLPGEFVCKDYSENEYIAEAIFETELFEDTGKKVAFGHVKCPVWKIK